MNINEQEVEKLIEETKNKVSKTADEIINEKKSNNDPFKKNETPKDQINLGGELGTFKRVTKEEAKIVFDHLPTTVFQIHKCLFRICFVNEGKNRFTAELINLEEKKD